MAAGLADEEASRLRLRLLGAALVKQSKESTWSRDSAAAIDAASGRSGAAAGSWPTPADPYRDGFNTYRCGTAGDPSWRSPRPVKG